MEPTTAENPIQPENTDPNRLPEIYALIWRSTATDEEFDQSEFESRIPRLMEWLRALYAGGHLVACGGGGFENHAGGLTLIRAANVEEALELSKGTPMNEIGSTEVFIWDLYFADLVNKKQETVLSRLAVPDQVLRSKI